MSKIQHFKFTILLTLADTLPKGIHDFGEQMLRIHILSEEISLEFFFSHVVPCYEKDKKWQEYKNLKFHISLNNFGRDPPTPPLAICLICFE